MTFADLRGLFLLTLRDPAGAAAALRGLNLPMSTRWMALALAVSLSAILAWLGTRLFPVEIDNGFTRMTGQPLVVAAVQFGVVLFSAALMAGVGRAFGGRGDFADALLLLTWIEFVLLAVQVAQVALVLVFPATAAVLSLVAMILFVGLFVLFTKALHGFHSTLKVSFGVLATLLATGILASILATALGLAPPVPA